MSYPNSNSRIFMASDAVNFPHIQSVNHVE